MKTNQLIWVHLENGCYNVKMEVPVGNTMLNVCRHYHDTVKYQYICKTVLNICK